MIGLEANNGSGSSKISGQDMQFAQDIAARLITGLETVIRGRTDTIRLVLTALFADGHVLLEDYPGSGKTTLTKTLGALIDSDQGGVSNKNILPFRRIQFTPDLLPGDVLGVSIFEPKEGRFQFLHGPVFAHVVLADEINRAGPKVQAAFLECMAEKQVTIDNVTYPLDEFFFVIGTQNPLDIAGTYPLPLVQLDRFLLKIPMSYVDAETEKEILDSHGQIKSNLNHLSAVCKRSDILKTQAVAQTVYVAPALRDAIVAIVQATRNNPTLQFGASTRAALSLQAAIKSWALVNGRDHCTEDDLKTILPFVLLHRLKFLSATGDPLQALHEVVNPIMDRLVRGR